MCLFTHLKISDTFKYYIVTVTFKVTQVKGHEAKWKTMHDFLSIKNCNHVSMYISFYP